MARSRACLQWYWLFTRLDHFIHHLGDSRDVTGNLTYQSQRFGSHFVAFHLAEGLLQFGDVVHKNGLIANDDRDDVFSERSPGHVLRSGSS